jgi:hypothetical protein
VISQLGKERVFTTYMFRPKDKVSSSNNTKRKQQVTAKKTKPVEKKVISKLQSKKRANLSSDTLVSKPEQSTKPFIRILNEKAIIIQRWFRSTRLTQKPKLQAGRHPIEEYEILKRRKDMAERARQEIVKELQQHQDTLFQDEEINQVEYEDDFESLEETESSLQDIKCLPIEPTPECTISDQPVQQLDLIQKPEEILTPEIDSFELNGEDSNVMLLTSEQEPDYMAHYAPTPIPLEIQNPTNEKIVYEHHFAISGDTDSYQNSHPLPKFRDQHAILEPFFDDENSSLSSRSSTPMPNKQWTKRTLESKIETKPLILTEEREVAAFRSTATEHTRLNRSPSFNHNRATVLPCHKDLSNDSTSESVSRIFDLLKSVESSASPLPKRLQSPEEANHKESVFDGIKSKILQQQLEIENKSKMIESLKEELKRQREMNKQELQQHQKSAKSQLNLQRKEYETIVKRNLCFIDKVLAEKEELAKKSLDLTEQVKNLDKTYQAKLTSFEQDQARELKQQREIWQAGEKLKRDKWIQEKTKTIKDQTVQSLEPEIQKLIAQHKLTLRKAEESYRENLSREKSLSAENHQRQIETLREKFISERQKACEEEREFARQRYIKQLERDEMEFQQQKRKMLSEFDEERHRIQEASIDHLKQVDVGHKRSITQLRKEIDDERNQKEQVVEELRKKHQQNFSQLQQQLQVEKEEWQANYMKKVEQQVRVREVLYGNPETI